MNIALEQANELLSAVKKLVDGEYVENPDLEGIKVGLDLGTSSIVLVVVDKNNRPIFAASQDANVVRDGLVVDYIGATSISRRLKDKAEQVLGIELTHAAGAIPPGTVGNNKNVIKNIIEACGMECVAIVDEPTAAAYVLNISEGGVVDVGGGTTGISILENGKVVFAGDEATGGTQMTQVISGYYKIPQEEGEIIKRDKTKDRENFLILRPVIEKMATISYQFIQQYGKSVREIYVVGGATNFDDFTSVFEKLLQVPVYKPLYPQFVTPLGIALAVDGPESDNLMD